MNYALTNQQDSYDEISGVRERTDVATFIHCGRGDEPGPVYVAPPLGERSYYVGVRFPLGIVVDGDWEAKMIADGIGLDVIESTWAWLVQRAL